MIKKTFTYTDFNDVERTEDFYFNLTEAELTEMELSEVGGFTEAVQKIVASKDVPAIIAVFKMLIAKSYGEKSADGRRFVKKDPVDGHLLFNDFECTEAFSMLYMELATDEAKASEFIKGVVPAKLSQKMNEINKEELLKVVK